MQQLLDCTLTDFNWNNSSTTLMLSSESNYIYGILYEILWHTRLSNISELNYLYSNPSSCNCSSYCTTSPIIKCLPSYDPSFNSWGSACSNECTSKSLSCHTDNSCITMTMPNCLYNLYSRESKNCIFHCSDNSCICTLKPFVCSCISGYTLVPGSKYACIPNTWSDYNLVDFKYTIKCSEGYTPGCNGNCCVCAIGYKAIQTDPLKCGFDTLRCKEYSEGDTLFTCAACETGYIVGCDGKCCICDQEYVKVNDDPLECASEISNCEKYSKNNGYWICELCNEGYKLGNNQIICLPDLQNLANCKYYHKNEDQYVCVECIKGYALDSYGICNLCAEGYEGTYSNPLLCELVVSNCEVYYIISNPRRCDKCSEGYKLSESGLCDDCYEGYVAVIRDTLRCYQSIPHCLEYDISNDTLKCSNCEMEYKADRSGGCGECTIGNTVVQEMPLLCAKIVDYCEEYNIINDEVKCFKCNSNFVLKSERKCECTSGFYISEGSCIECPKWCSECISFNIAPHCTSCAPGYKLQTNSSIPLCYESNNQNESEDSIEISDEYPSALDSSSIFIVKSNIISQSVIIATLIISIVSFNFNTMFQLLGTTQMLSYILLYNLSLRNNINTILKGMNFFEIIPNIFKYFATHIDNLGIERFERMEYNNEVFLINSGKTLTIFIIAFIIYLSLKIARHITTKNISQESLGRFLTRILSELEWGFFIGLFIEVP
jgi:hypothetical protein